MKKAAGGAPLDRSPTMSWRSNGGLIAAWQKAVEATGWDARAELCTRPWGGARQRRLQLLIITMCTCIAMPACVDMYACTHACEHTYTLAYMHTYKHVFIHVNV